MRNNNDLHSTMKLSQTTKITGYNDQSYIKIDHKEILIHEESFRKQHPHTHTQGSY